MRRKLLSFLIVGLAAVAGLVGLESVKAQSVYNGRFDHPSNIIRGGTLTKAEFTQRYNENKTGDLPAIFRHYGLNPANIGAAHEGSVTASGEVKVNGKVVATGAYALGRQTLGSPQARAVQIAGKTYYEKPMAASIAPHKEVTAFVFLDNTGKYMGAIMKSCGNPVTAKPVPQPAAECVQLTGTMTSRTRYSLNANGRAVNGAKITGYRYVITNANGQTVLDRTVNTSSTGSAIQGELTQPGTYTARVIVKTSLGDRPNDKKCVAQLTVKPAPAAECVRLVHKITNRNHYQLNANGRASNGATINGYRYVITNANGQTVLNRTVNTSSTGSSIQGTLDPGTYTAQVFVQTSLDEKTGDNCKTRFTVKDETIRVCIIKDQKWDTITKSEYEKNKHLYSTNPDDCEDIYVCVVEKKTWENIRKSEFDESIHSLDEADCEEEPPVEEPPVEEPPVEEPEVPTELPQTGTAENVSAVIGLGSLITSLSYYVASRRGVISALINR